MQINRIFCAICNSNLIHIYELNNYPIKFSTVNYPIYDSSPLSFSQCSICNTIQLDKLVPLPVLYSDNHNYTSVGKTWNDYFNTISNKLFPIVNDKNVLEIGDPSGKIANKLNNYKKWYIVEPNKNKDIVFNDNVEFIEQFFDEFVNTQSSQFDNKIDIIVHSHLFEHIYEPCLFLKKCYNILNENGEMCFGVPNMEYITTEELCPFVGLGFEHNIFLNKENIKYMLEKTGFELIDIIYYENHSVIYHCVKLNNPVIENISISIIDYKPCFFNILQKYKKCISEYNEIIENNIDKQIYVFGASYYVQALFVLGLKIENVCGILDNCIEKQNKYFYGFNLMIYNPSIIQNQDCIVIVKNGYYSDEIKAQLIILNSNCILL